MVDLSDPKTFELTLTNLGLGLVVLVCCIAVLRAFLLDLLDKVLTPKTESDLAVDNPPAGQPSAKLTHNPSLIHGAKKVARHVMSFTAAGIPVDPRVEPPAASR